MIKRYRASGACSWNPSRISRTPDDRSDLRLAGQELCRFAFFLFRRERGKRIADLPESLIQLSAANYLANWPTARGISLLARLSAKGIRATLFVSELKLGSGRFFEYSSAMIFFNTTGPVDSFCHYLIPPLSRIDLPEILRLISTRRYFVLHAPRQTGKTSTLLALRDHLNSSGDYRCVYANVEAAQTAREDIDSAMRTILSEFSERSLDAEDNTYPDAVWPDLLERSGANSVFNLVLSRWASNDAKPLVLLIDEIDSLVGDTLISVLRQLRSGYDRRPERFPQSVVLCGVRDVRDYRIHASSEKEIVTGGSAFNIKAKSLRLGDFSEAEMRALLMQHTEETGQAFAEESFSAIWEQTQGQPWLVNALAWEICFENRYEPGRLETITHDDVVAAREALILRHDTHLDQLTDKLQEDRVRRVVGPILAGSEASNSTSEDKKYIRDLGLVAQNAPLRIANPIYAEVIPRVLTDAVQDELAIEPAFYVNSQGELDMHRLVGDFQQFFRENSESWVNRFAYSEAGCQLLLQAFLQRVVNGGGSIEREYGLGKMRTDLLIRWPMGGETQNFVVECKLRHKSLDATIAEGLKQTALYMDRCGATGGHLVIFDRSGGRSWEEKIFRRNATRTHVPITIWGM